MKRPIWTCQCLYFMKCRSLFRFWKFQSHCLSRFSTMEASIIHDCCASCSSRSSLQLACSTLTADRFSIISLPLLATVCSVLRKKSHLVACWELMSFLGWLSCFLPGFSSYATNLVCAAPLSHQSVSFDCVLEPRHSPLSASRASPDLLYACDAWALRRSLCVAAEAHSCWRSSWTSSVSAMFHSCSYSFGCAVISKA